jgi:hypothetical protein
MSTLQQIAIENITCARCGAEPGKKCTTITGGRGRYAHVDRTYAAQRAWWEGFADGCTDWTRAIIFAAENGAWDQLVTRARREAKWIAEERS